MPADQRPGMGREIGFVRRQDRSQVAQLVKFAQRLVWRRLIDDPERESRVLLKDAEKDELAFVDRSVEFPARQQPGSWRITSDEALSPPDRHEAAVVASQRFGQPLVVLAALTAAVDECAGEYVLILGRHRAQFKLKPGLRGQFRLSIRQDGQVASSSP